MEANPRDEPRREWRITEGGLAVPDGIRLGDHFWPSSTSLYDQKVRERLFEDRVGRFATFEELWPEEPEPSIDEVLRRLAGSSASAMLVGLSLAFEAHDLGWKGADRLVYNLLPPRGRERFDALGRTPRIVLTSHFVVLAALGVLLGNSRGLRPLTGKAEDVAKFLVLVADRLHRVEDDDDFSSFAAGMAAALFERAIMTDALTLARRAIGIWSWQMPVLSQQAASVRSRVDMLLRDHAGLTLDQWTAASALFIHQCRQIDIEAILARRAAFRPEEWPIALEAQAICGRAFRFLSQPVEAVVAAYEAANAEESLLRRPTLIPLSTKPFIALDEDGGGGFPAAAFLIGEAAVRGPIMSTPAQDPLRTDFGELVECYVHSLFARLYGDRYQRLAPPRKRKRADGVIVCEEGCIVVEVKSRWLSETQRFQRRTNDQLKEQLISKSGKDLPRALEQIAQTQKDLITGELDVCQVSTNIMASIIVVPDHLPLNVVARDVLLEVLPPYRLEGGRQFLPPQIMSLSEVEELELWLTEPLLKTLALKMRHADLALESFGGYMRSIKRTRRATRETSRELAMLIFELWRRELKLVPEQENDASERTAAPQT